MIDAAVQMQEFTRGLDFDAFLGDPRTIRAVERDFVILGEAARNIPQAVRMRYPLVPWARIIAMRNIIVHQYRRVDPDVLWDTIQNNFPTFIPALREISEHEQ